MHFSKMRLCQYAESNCMIQLGVLGRKWDRKRKRGFQLVLQEKECFSEGLFDGILRFVGNGSKQPFGAHTELLA